MGAYIKGAGLISPQYTYNSEGFPTEIRNEVTDRLLCVEPDYRTLINPLLLRRMPRILKMGLGASQLCIKRAGCNDPEGIIVGTGLGCLENLEKFLIDVLENEENVTSVLPFINSTHNAVAAQISMMLKNQNYNTTYCHRGFSFETALQDAMLLIEEKNARNVLVGGIDECTPDFMLLHSYLDAWKTPVNNLELLSGKSTGTLAGEGSGFFMLSDACVSYPDSVSIERVQTFLDHEEAGAGTVEAEIALFLDDLGITIDSIDGVLLGLNGDMTNDRLYYSLSENFFANKTILYYKHLCGEYYTSGAFALWLAYVILKERKVPPVVLLHMPESASLNNILIYNRVNHTEHSLIYVKYGCL